MSSTFDPERERYLDQVLRFREAEKEGGMSVGTLRRERDRERKRKVSKGKSRFIRISKGLWGIRRRDLLQL